MHVLGVQEQVRKRVGFMGGVQTADDPDVARPSRLHRRDTPHHLKNKRIMSAFDKDKVASIIAQVSFANYFYYACFFAIAFLDDKNFVQIAWCGCRCFIL